MRPIVIATALLVVGALAMPAAAAPPRQVFQTTGTVYIQTCSTCEWAVERVTRAAGLPDVTDVIDEDVISGALANGATLFTLRGATGLPLPPDVSITFYDANGYPMRSFTTPGDEMGAIPTGAAQAVVRVQSGLVVQYTYTEYVPG